MGPYQNITREKVVALHKLLRFLRRLDVIGRVQTCTLAPSGPIAALEFADGLPGSYYSVEFVNYSEDREEMRAELILEKLFEHRMATDGFNTHFKF